MHRTLQVLTAEQQDKVAMLREQRMKGKKAMMDERQADWHDNCGDGSLRVRGQDAVNRSRPLRAENVVSHRNRRSEQRTSGLPGTACSASKPGLVAMHAAGFAILLRGILSGITL